MTPTPAPSRGLGTVCHDPGWLRGSKLVVLPMVKWWWTNTGGQKLTTKRSLFLILIVSLEWSPVSVHDPSSQGRDQVLRCVWKRNVPWKSLVDSPSQKRRCHWRWGYFKDQGFQHWEIIFHLATLKAQGSQPSPAKGDVVLSHRGHFLPLDSRALGSEKIPSLG